MWSRQQVSLAACPISRSLLVFGLLSGVVTICVAVMLSSLWLEALTCLLTFYVTGAESSILRHEHSYEAASTFGHPSEHPQSNSSIPHHGLHGGVASESEICSGIGRDLLLKGGNAADAMVGTVFCVGVIGMYHSGIGGGGFMLVRGSDGEYEYIDFRETAPAAAFQDMYKNDINASIYGGLAR